MMKCIRALLITLFAFFLLSEASQAELLSRDAMQEFVIAPMALGERLTEDGVWELENSGGSLAGYVFETGEMAPLPGFAGVPINLFVAVDLEGRFIDVRLINHHEPIFVSGLGEAPLRQFLEQYRGLSISQTMVVGTPYGDGSAGSSLVYLDGVTKATASVRIAHESILAATRKVARERLAGIASAPPASPNFALTEPLGFDELEKRGLIARLTVTNAEVDKAFAGTRWANEDPLAKEDPEGIYLDLWVIDIGSPSVANSVLTKFTQDQLTRFLELTPFAEPFLLLETGRHGLVDEEFIRNTSPDWISASQDGLPVALRDADLNVELTSDFPEGVAMILRTDRRLGFDPSREWTLQIDALRERGMFQPEIGSTSFSVNVQEDPSLYITEAEVKPVSPLYEALRNRATDLIIASAFLVILLWLVGPKMHRIARKSVLTKYRLVILAFVVGFVGWWGQGQLSIVTVLRTVQALVWQQSLEFLLYDPFSLLIWGATALGFVLWGRGLFCGWLCPFGALQEFAHHIGRLLRIPQITVPSKLDGRLKLIKYVALLGLIVTALITPENLVVAAELEPFKTAISVFFVRDWYYVFYAAFWLILATSVFKGFCRYVCPLGAFMAIAGIFRTRDWIDRRRECGSPCQLCKVKCKYGSIKKSGEISYSECFQCLDCVQIFDDKAQCVPLILSAKREARQ